jgi:hypothetical protein
MDFFENGIFWQILNMNLNKIVWKKIRIFSKIFLKTFSKIFQEYSKNISPKAIKKQVGVAHVISFAP